MMKTFVSIIASVAATTVLLSEEITNRLITSTESYHIGRINGGVIDTIVIHFTSDVAVHPTDPFDVDSVIKIFTDTKTSAHYLIDRDGKIYRLVNEADTAYHAGRGLWQGRTLLNPYSIGIELLGIGSAEEMRRMIGMSQTDYDKIPAPNLGFTDKQYKSLGILITDIESRYPKITHDRQHIIGHNEFAPDRKVDPGITFKWAKIGMRDGK